MQHVFTRLVPQHEGWICRYYSSDAEELIDAQTICKDPLTTWEQWLVKAGWKTKFDEQLGSELEELKVSEA